MISNTELLKKIDIVDPLYKVEELAEAQKRTEIVVRRLAEAQERTDLKIENIQQELGEKYKLLFIL